MPGETKVHKPLAVEKLGSIFQKLDPATVVFNEVVVGTNQLGNSVLSSNVGIGYPDLFDVPYRKLRLGSATLKRANLCLKQLGL